MMKKISWLTLIGCAFFSVSPIADAIEGKDVSIDFLAVSPRMIQGDATGYFDRRSPGLFVVGVGEKSFLHGRLPENEAAPTTIEWTFTEFPVGSAAAFGSADRLQTSFAPDKEGWFGVQLSLTFSGLDAPIVKTTRVLAATYSGVGGMDGGNAKFPECSLCHASVAGEWKETRHANVLANHLNGERSEEYDTTCFECHTLGFDRTFQALDNGFHNAVQNENVDLQEIADSINEAYRLNHDGDSSNDAAYYDSLLPSLKAKASVQCENCHGPGSQHMGNPAQIGKAWDGRVCAQCHDSQGHDNYPYPFDSSAHKELPETFQEYPMLLNTPCAQCHSAEAFVRLTIKNDPNLPVEATDPHAISCVACHDPHDKTNPNQVRWMGDVVLGSGYEFKDAGKGSLCVLCHQSQVSSDLESFIRNDTHGPHYGPQADILLGVNAWTFGDEVKDRISVHKVLLEDACVTCHMARIPEDGWSVESGILAGGHSFKITNDLGTESKDDDVSNHRNSCVPCHLTMTSVDRVMQSGRDYDGNGTVEGIQTEVRGLMARIVERLQEKYPTVTVDDELNLTIPSTLFSQFTFAEKAAIYNYRLFLRDGSFGVHNGRFTIEVLQKSYAALALRSFKLDYPNAYVIGTSSISEWSEYKD